jgi:hypothetical protein
MYEAAGSSRSNDSGVKAAAAAAQQQQQHSSRGWILQTTQLRHLQLRGLLVDNPIRCKLHGSSDCECQVC